MIIKNILKAMLLILIATITHAQKISSEYSTKNKKAIKLYEDALLLIDVNRQYDRGFFTLNKAVELDPNFIEAHEKMANCYLTINNQKLAKKHLLKVVDIAPFSAQYQSVYFNLGRIYLNEGNYEESRTYLEKVLSFPHGNPKKIAEAKDLLDRVAFALVSQENALSFEPLMLNHETINRFRFQSHPVLTANQEFMLYSVRDGVTAEYDEEIVIARRNGDDWSVPQSISPNINTQLNEGFASISGDGKVLVFTSCDRRDGQGSCDLYISYRTGNDWSKAKNMGAKVNSRNWDSTPSLTADGRRVYFSSDRPGGMGGKDLWYTDLGDDGEWLPPLNMGGNINTKKSEVTPFIHANGKYLYFASDGFMGLGGYDLYLTKRIKDREWTMPNNLGSPINTKDNEGSLYITPDFEKGYYEKYTLDGRNSFSRIYEFDLPDALKPSRKCIYAQGVVYDAIEKTPIRAEVDLVNLRTGELASRVKSDDVSGEYLIVLVEGSEYALNVRAEGYMFYSFHFDFSDDRSFDPLMLDVYLQPLTSKEPITLTNIFFETGSFELMNKSFYELDRLVDLLKTNPNLKLEIAGHTDNIGSPKDNMTLSHNRAKAVYDYLVKNGIESAKLTYKGYGETKPVADNASLEGRQRNRRIEFKVI